MKRSILLTLLTLFVLGSIIGLVAYIYINQVVNKTEQELSSIVQNATNGAYRLEASRFDFSFSGIEAEDIHLIPNPSYFDTTQILSHSADIKIKSVHLSIENFTFNSVSIKQITLTAPDVQLKEHNQFPKPVFLPQQNTTPQPGKATIQHVLLKDIHLSYTSIDQQFTFELVEGKISLSDIEIEQAQKLTYSFGEMKFNSKTIDVTSYPYQVISSNSSYSSQQEILKSGQLEFHPIISKKEYWKWANTQKSYPELTIDSLRASEVGFTNFFSKKFTSKEVHIHHPVLSFTKDKNTPVANPKPKELLHRIVRKLPVQINTCHLINGLVNVNQIPQNESSVQTIQLDKFNGKLTNINFLKSQPMTWNFNFSINSKGNAAITYDFPSNLNQPLSIKGNVKDVPLQLVNSYIPTQSPVKFKGGKIAQLNFNCSATNQSSKGKVSLKTNGLQLERMTGQSNNKVINSILAIGGNAYHQIKSKGETQAIQGHINFKRNPNKQVFHYTLHSVLSGVVDAYSL